MTTDPSTEREEAAEDAADLWTRQQGYAMTGTEWGAFAQGHLAGSAWARTHLAAPEPTAAEHRIAHLEAQTDARGRAVVISRDRAREAEAERDWNIRSSRLAKEERIKANARAESAEARIRDLTQEVRDERGAALDALEQIKVRDARIKAVEDALSYADMGETLVTRSRIRRALEGDA